VDQPSKYLMFLPALALLAGVVALQRGRNGAIAAQSVPAAQSAPAPRAAEV
jgi:hypothetical protein